MTDRARHGQTTTIWVTDDKDDGSHERNGAARGESFGGLEAGWRDGGFVNTDRMGVVGMHIGRFGEIGR